MFKEIISRIKPLDTESMDKCQLRLDNLTKPLNSLLYFEQIARQMAGITHNPRPRTVKKSIIILTSAGAKPSIATNVFAEHVGAQIVTVDIATIAKAQTVQQEILSAIEWGINIAGAEIAKGTQIDRLSYVKDIQDDKDSTSDLYRKIQITGTVDVNTPGTYELTYYVVDSNGNASNGAVLTIVVK